MTPTPAGGARPDVVVVGGGAFGLSAAVALRRRGRSVTVVDAGPVPHPEASSTDISKIIRMDYGADAFYAAMAEEALAVWRRWNGEQARPLYHETGFLLLSEGPMEPGGFEYESRAVLASMGHEVERLGGAALAERFRAWPASSWADGYWNPAAGWAESGRAVAWLAEVARGEGVEIVEDRPAAALLDAPGVGVRMRDGATLEAGTVVVAAGAWTPTLLPEMARVMEATGQAVFHLRPSDPERWGPDRLPVWGGDIARTGWYGFPANADGLVKVANHGAGVRLDPRGPKEVPERFDGALRRFLAAKLPGLADAPVVARRLCMYCDTPDGDFWIDRHPDRPGVVVLAGGSGHGFKFMPVLGDVVADLLDGASNRWAPRFRWRTPDASRAEEARFHGDTFADA